ncbi:hypothetical protein GLI01_34500 [Gluconacetobacter liquefaciens]|uniref:Uncharacterized protein n=1 Tax=Gluconacetobacter liquefaciens TaxID=89584 RepID=A0A370GAH8_GLULI|nr:hypothetical protein [Gluconacetobacter liquefaciens]RDI40798.1 hypothetical protein C7453_101597 [Gluconacetobacter liquefaciens]GBR07320.1 hypothetical protein AA0522_2166 [Gluconacetobacter liquefaciens NRIC 0522]GEB39415.1 hypothetical protein GLI01_34500 [Gluconacetobacter liquefaciens]
MPLGRRLFYDADLSTDGSMSAPPVMPDRITRHACYRLQFARVFPTAAVALFKSTQVSRDSL